MKLDSFQAQSGVHCESTMLRNMLHHAGVAVSEAMIFGLGQGIDFQCWESPDPETAPPMLTGRNGAGELAHNACVALGIELEVADLDGSDAAHEGAVAILDSGRVLGVTVDIYHLDYFASDSHFSAHCIALYGLDDATANVVDTTQQGGSLQLPTESLRLARSSNEGYMPSPNRQFHLGEISPEVKDDLDALLVEQSWPALLATSKRMVSDRGEKLGPAALRLAATELPAWAEKVEDPAAWLADLGRFWRYAGTGGANFRWLFCEYLRELEQRSGGPDLPMFIEDFEWIHARWVEVIDLLIGCSDSGDHQTAAESAQRQLLAIADAEERSFRRLLAMAGERVRGPR